MVACTKGCMDAAQTHRETQKWTQTHRGERKKKEGEIRAGVAEMCLHPHGPQSRRRKRITMEEGEEREEERRMKRRMMEDERWKRKEGRERGGGGAGGRGWEEEEKEEKEEEGQPYLGS